MNSIIKAMFENKIQDIAVDIFSDMKRLIDDSLTDKTVDDLAQSLPLLASKARHISQEKDICEILVEELIVYGIYENLYDHDHESFGDNLDLAESINEGWWKAKAGSIHTIAWGAADFYKLTRHRP